MDNVSLAETNALPTTSGACAPSLSNRAVWLLAVDAEWLPWLQQLLIAAGCQVRVFANPERLAEAKDAATPDALLVVADAGANSDDERALLRAARDLLPVTPLLLLGRQVDLEARLAALRAGASHYLPCPPTPEHLLRILAETCLPPTAARVRVLLVGRDAELERAAPLLAEAGMQVERLCEPRALLPKLRAFGADLVILDDASPDCPGAELARILSGDECHAHRVCLLLSDDESPWPAFPVLTKPLVRERLLERVEDLLRRDHGTLDAARHAARDFARAVIDGIPSLFLLLDDDLRLVDCNALVPRVTGYTAEELKRMTVAELFSAAERPRAIAGFATAFEQDRPMTLDLYLIGRSGARAPFRFQTMRYCTNGRAMLIVTAQDMSAYQGALDSLRLSEERLSRSQAYANVGLWDWNAKAERLYWSDRVPALLGVSEITLGCGLLGMIEAAHPEDRERLRQAIDRCLAGQDVCDEQVRVRAPNGQLRWVLVRGNALQDQIGVPRRMLGIVQDIDRLKQAEQAERCAREQLQSIIDSLQSPICVVDGTGRICSVNRTWRDFDSALLPHGAPLDVGGNYLDCCARRAAQGRQDMDRLARGIRSVLDGRKPSHESQIQFSLDQSKKFFLVRVTPLLGATAQEPRVVVSHRDITEAHRIEADLRVAKEVAERANRAKSEFLSAMTHELRTPMNAVLGFAQLLDYDERLDTDQRENVHEILRAGQRLLELINSVLDLAQVETERFELTIEPLWLAPVIEESHILLQPLAETRGIRIEIDAAGLAGLAVLADRARLKQILVNLLSNAIKYNRAEGRVAVRAVPQAERPEIIRLEVADTGPGIDAQRMAELFKPFVRLASGDADGEGSGIGLAICRRLIEAMGGSIGVSSELHEGSRFWIDLPVAEDEWPEDPEPPVAPDRQGCDANGGTTRFTLLYIEDRPSNLAWIEQLFARRPDLRLLNAPSASVGLDLARGSPPDAILMDIDMPGLDGHAALAALQADPRTRAIPVVALTAEAMPGDVERGLAAGFADYLTKPFDMARLMATLERLLDQPARSNTAN